ncbi:MAG: ABC transporter ATP-binding protein [Bacilli bacterium]
MIHKLAKYTKGVRKETILSPILVILEVLLEVGIPYMMAKIIDVGIPNKDIGYIAAIGGIMIGMAALSLLFGALSARFSAIASTGFSKNIRSAMFHNIQDFSFSNLDKFSTSSLITRLTTDVTNTQNAFQMLIRVLFRAPVMLISATVMAIIIKPDLSLVFVIAVAFLAIALFFIIGNAHKYFKQMFKKYDKVNAVVQENLIGMRVVKSFVSEERENEKFKEASGELYHFSVKAERLIALNGPLMQLTMYASVMAIAWFGGKMIITNSGLEIGNLMSYITYTNQILMSLMMLSFVIVMLTISRASVERIIEVIDEKSSLQNPINPIDIIRDGSIEFKNVDFSYSNNPENLNLHAINLKIKAGETIGIIGGTGSSKTTLVQLIPRLYDVLKGEVKVGGRNVHEYSLDALRDQVAMVLQQNVLFSGSIEDNLRWGKADASTEELIEVCKKAQAHDFIMSFPNGYQTQLGQGGLNVSGGQKQRLTIARALLKKPKILILDDSTSAVDTKTDAYIRQAFRNDLSNMTKIIIAQRITSVEDADRIIILNEGKIHAFDSPKVLLETNEIYQDLYQSQMKGAQ